jgi:hypothetical protein
MGKKEITIFSVIEFTSIITLYEADGKAKMSINVSLKIVKDSVDVRLVTKRKSPDIV